MIIYKIIKSLFFKSKLYNYYLLKNNIKEILFTPKDIWPGDPILGDKIVQGHYEIAGEKNYSPDNSLWFIPNKGNYWMKEAHSFTWLRHLKARSGHLARKHARYLILEWIKTNEKWNENTWEVEVLSRRVSSWLTNIDFLLAEKDEDFSAILKKNLFKQIKHLQSYAKKSYFFHLDRKLGLENASIKKVKILRGLILSTLCFDDANHKVIKYLRLLELELYKNFNSEGVHVSKSPSTQLSILGDLVTIREAIKSNQMDVMETLVMTIQKASHSLRFFRTPNGDFATFNGSKQETKFLIDKILNSADGKARAKGPISLYKSGFEKLTRKQTTLFVDTFRYNNGFLSRAPHAIQINIGKEKLFGSCGSIFEKNQEWKESLLSASAHSSLIIESTNPSIKDNQIKEPSSKRYQKNGSEIINLVHYGYKEKFSAVCSRTIEVGGTGKIIAVLDQIFSDKLLKFDIRLHLNTKAKVSLSLDKRKAIIILNDQGWLFNYEGQFKLSLEPSIFACDNGRINKTSQLILRGETLKENTEVLWGIKKDI